MDISHRDSQENEIKFNNSTKEHNESHASFCQADDEFNVAIREMSSSNTQDEDEDEEEICATPAAPTSAVKRERFKDQSTRSIRIHPAPNSASAIIENKPPIKIKQETGNSQEPYFVASDSPVNAIDHSNVQKSPLRGIENYPTKWCSTRKVVASSPVSRVGKHIKVTSLLFNDEDPKHKPLESIETRHKEASRKSLSLSTKKTPRLKQALLEFSGVKSGKKKSNGDSDVSILSKN